MLRYVSLEGTVQSLRGMTRRFNLKYNLEDSLNVFKGNEEVIANNFDLFFKDIQSELSKTYE